MFVSTQMLRRYHEILFKREHQNNLGRLMKSLSKDKGSMVNMMYVLR